MSPTDSGSSRSATAPAPFFRYYGTPASYRDVLVASLLGSLDRDADKVRALEQQVSGWIGTRHALALPQARVGLYLALRSVLTPERRKVVLSPYTIWDVVNMVLCAGGTPVFADVDEGTFNIDFDAAKGLVDGETGAVLITHLNGLACDVERFAALCAERGVPLVEDCAQAFGARVGGRRVGSFGSFAVFSFSVKKHVSCLLGGCLVGNDGVRMSECAAFLEDLPPEATLRLARRAAETLAGEIAAFGPIFRGLTFPLLRRRVERGGETALFAVRYEHEPERRHQLPERYLRRLTSCQARLVSRQLPDVDRQTEIRRSYAREYHARLGDLAGIQLPPLREDGSHIYLSFAIQLEDRVRVQQELMAAGCDVRLQAFTNLATAPAYSDFARDCPRAERAASRALLLPICPGAGIGEIRRVADAIRTLLR